MSTRAGTAVAISLALHLALVCVPEFDEAPTPRRAAPAADPVIPVEIEFVTLQDEAHGTLDSDRDSGAAVSRLTPATSDAPANSLGRAAGDARGQHDERARGRLSTRHGSEPADPGRIDPGPGPIARFDPRAPAVPAYDPTPTPAPGSFDNGLRPKPRKPKTLGKNTDDGPFVARTASDGKVVFDDKPNVRFGLPKARNIAQHLESWSKDPYGTSRNVERVSIESHKPDGTSETIETVKIFGGGFDLTDAIMRRRGQDPYSARKRAFLDRTRDERAGMARVEQSEQLREALPALKKDVARVWASGLPAKERRALLFEMWDECAESGSDEVVTAAARARSTILAFIRRELPRAAADAYTRREIAELNARRTSRAAFVPYPAKAAGKPSKRRQ